MPRIRITEICIVTGLAATLVICGCASFSSSVDDTDAVSDGLVYRLPKRDFLVTITPPPSSSSSSSSNAAAPLADGAFPAKPAAVAGAAGGGGAGASAAGAGTPAGTGTPPAEGDAAGAKANTNEAAQSPASSSKATVVSVDAGPAYPDLSKRFVLGYQRNYVGTNKINISVNEKGLLGSAGAESKSGVAEFLTSIVKTAGYGLFSVEQKRAEDKPECTSGQPYTISISPNDIEAHDNEPPAAVTNSSELCGFKIEGKKLFSITDRGVGKDSQNLEKFEAGKKGPFQAGVYYRQSFPYKIVISEAKNPSNRREFIIFSPSEAPISFLPIKRGVFADANATLTFTDGMPTGYAVSTDGELVALAKLPATVIAAYFSAIGELLAFKKTNAVNEKEYLNAVNSLAVAQLKRKNCKDAVDSQDDEKISKRRPSTAFSSIL